MSTSVPPRDAGAPTGSISAATSAIPNEQALRALFDAEFATCIETAKSQLGDAPMLAPRVVETAFANAWAQRATLRDATQAKAFLASEVQHGAARALSRRAAAQRFGGQAGRESRAGGSGAADPARSWAEVEKAISGAGASNAAHAAVADVTRHEAAAHMKSVGKGRSWVLPVIGGTIVLACLAAAGLYFDRLGEDDAILTQVGGSTMQPLLQSNAGQIGSTSLNDGTKVRVGPDTKLFVPDGFPSKIRAVRIEGTAQFDVAAGQVLPFRVIANKTHFIATGTSFIISAYPIDSSASVLVKEGTVTVKAPKGTQAVAAGQALLVDTAGLHTPSDDQKGERFGWADGRITVHKQLRGAVAAMARWFNMEIKVSDLPLLDRDAQFSVALDSSRQAITEIEKSANVKFVYEGDNKVFVDASAAKAAPGAKPAAAKTPAKTPAKAAGKKK